MWNFKIKVTFVFTEIAICVLELTLRAFGPFTGASVVNDVWQGRQGYFQRVEGSKKVEDSRRPKVHHLLRNPQVQPFLGLTELQELGQKIRSINLKFYSKTISLSFLRCQPTVPLKISACIMTVKLVAAIVPGQRSSTITP